MAKTVASALRSRANKNTSRKRKINAVSTVLRETARCFTPTVYVGATPCRFVLEVEMKNEENKSVELSRTKALIAEVSGEELTEEKFEVKYRAHTLSRVLLCLLSVALFSLFLVYFLKFNALKKKTSLPPSASEQASVEVGTWRGAFDSAAISESAAEVCVGVRLGGIGGYSALSVSGFLISEDGWVATVDTLVASGQRGRLYVQLADGSEYAVETIVRDRESCLAFLKIDADRLAAVHKREAERLELGEQLIAVRSCGERLSVGIFSGLRVQEQTGGERLYTDMLLESTALGCPVFDGGGRAVGMAVDESGDVLAIDYVMRRFAELVRK